MRLAVLGAPDSWYLRDLCRAAGAHHHVQGLPFTALAARLQGGHPGQIWSRQGDGQASLLNDFDAVLVRGMPAGSLEQVVFRMNALAVLSRQIPVVNPPAALEVAIDKFLALARLQAAGFDIPPTVCCQTELQALEAFHQLGGDVVLKPLFGGEGRGVIRVTDGELAARAFRMLTQLNAAIYVQRYLPHAGADLRLLCVGDRVFGMRRVAVADWRTNLRCGGQARPLTVSPSLAGQAHLAARAVGAPICALDLLPADDGRCYALEVNAVPGWRGLAQVTGVDLSALVIDYLAALASGQVTSYHDAPPGSTAPPPPTAGDGR